MNFIRTKSFASISLLAAACAAAGISACSDDDNNGSSNEDAGSGGSQSSGGKSGTSGSTSSGGKSSGGTSSGGAVGTGASGGATVDASTDSGPGTADGGGDASDAGSVARLRLVHAAATAPAVDVYRKGTATAVATNIEYGSATPYVSLPEGSYQFDIRPAGAATTTDPVFTTPTIELAAGSKYTAVAEGDIGSTAAKDRFRVAAYQEQFAAASADKARVRIVHANFDGPAVDLDLDNDDPAHPDFQNLAVFDDTGPDGIEIAADTAVQVGVVVTGVPLTAFTTPKIAAGSDLFIIATGLASKLAREPLGLAALAVLPDSSTVLIRQNPRLYAVHASTDAGPLDAYIGAREVVDNVSFGGMKFFQVPPGAVKIDLFAGKAGATPRPAGDPVISLTTPALQAGNSYLGVAAGLAKTATPTLRLITAEEGFDLSTPAAARLRAVHASLNTPVVDVGLVTVAGKLDTPPAFAALMFGDASAAAGSQIPIGAETIGAAATGTTTTAAEFAVTTVAGQRAFAIAAGDFAGGALPLQLLVVDTTGIYWSIKSVAKK